MSEDKVHFKSVANYILPTSANLLGICFLIFSIIRGRGDVENTVLDDCCAAAIIIFLMASIFSYISIRSDGRARFEKWADWLFMAGLCLLATACLLMTFRLMS